MFTSFKKMMQRAVNAEAKTSLKFSIIIYNLDAHYFKSYYLFHNTFLIIQTQNSNNKNFFYFKKLKPKNLKLAPLHINMVEPAKKKDKKYKKKKF